MKIGLLPVQMSTYAWNADFPYLFTLSAEAVKPYLHIFRPQGYLYTVFGGLVEGIPDGHPYRTVIMVRDPRDVLVSGFYSYAYSHIAPPSEEKVEEFTEWRTFVQNLTLDEYAMEISRNLRSGAEIFGGNGRLSTNLRAEVRRDDCRLRFLAGLSAELLPAEHFPRLTPGAY